MITKKSYASTILPYLLVLLPAIFYFAKLNEYALNLPYRDDYDAILQFLIDFKHAHFMAKIGLLFSQHNEHRILSSNLIYAGYYSLFGHINFKALIIIGNAQLVVIFLTLLYFIRKCAPEFWYIPGLLLSLCIFDINSYENLTWAMAAMQNYGVIMLFLGSLYFYDKANTTNQKYLIAAILLQGLCAFSSGNGIIAGFALVLFNLFSANKLAKILSALFFVIFSALYFTHYKFGQPIPTNLTNITIFFMHMVSSHFTYDNYKIAAPIILVAAFLLLPISVKLKFIPNKNVIAILAILLFTGGSMFATSKFRSGNSLHDSYSSRYFIYSNLLAGLLFLLLFIKINKPIARWIVSAVAGLLLLGTYKSNSLYGDGGLARQQNRIQFTDFQDFPYRVHEANIASTACQENIYCIEENK